MAHGITLIMRSLKRPKPTHIVEHSVWETHVNPAKDRTLAGKARRRARRPARAAR